LAATSIAAGRIGDMVGRKGTLFAGALVFSLGGVVQTFTTGFYVMILGRVISGFGVGLLSCVTSPEIPYWLLTFLQFLVLLFQYIRAKYLLQIM
jgi:MFS family permease